MLVCRLQIGKLTHEKHGLDTLMLGINYIISGIDRH